MFVSSEVWQQLHSDCRDWRERYDALFEKYHQLKAAGASDTPPPVSPLVKRKPDKVAEVISDVAGYNAQLRRQLGVYARQAKQAGDSDDDIAHKLLNWDDDDQGIPE